jgi:flagellar basal body-associated protein FliL
MRTLFALLVAGVTLAASAPAAAEKKPAGPTHQFIRFQPVIVNTIDGGQISGLFSMTVTLKVADEAAVERLESQRVRINDLLTRTAFDYAATQVDVRRPVNWRQLTGFVQARINQLLAKEKARVLIVDASVREF